MHGSVTVEAAFGITSAPSEISTPPRSGHQEARSRDRATARFAAPTATDSVNPPLRHSLGAEKNVETQRLLDAKREISHNLPDFAHSLLQSARKSHGVLHRPVTAPVPTAAVRFARFCRHALGATRQLTPLPLRQQRLQPASATQRVYNGTPPLCTLCRRRNGNPNLPPNLCDDKL